MNIDHILSKMKEKALNDPVLRKRLLETKTAPDPLTSFCEILRTCGYDVYPMDIVDAGEEMYAAMKRSTNGGGENSPMLLGQDDLYEMFLMEIAEK